MAASRVKARGCITTSQGPIKTCLTILRYTRVKWVQGMIRQTNKQINACRTEPFPFSLLSPPAASSGLKECQMEPISCQPEKPKKSQKKLAQHTAVPRGLITTLLVWDRVPLNCPDVRDLLRWCMGLQNSQAKAGAHADCQ